MKALKSFPPLRCSHWPGLSPSVLRTRRLSKSCPPSPTSRSSDAALAKWFDTSDGYAVFPSIGKGGLIVGGAAGDGRVFEKGAYIGDVRHDAGDRGRAHRR